MPCLSVYNRILDCLITELSGGVVQAASGKLPAHLESMQETFSTHSMHPGFLLMIVAVPAVVIVAHVLATQGRRLFDRKPGRKANPEKLFEEILREVHLPEGDKYLLHEMVKGARLRQPAFCLLSPTLMYKTRQLWVEEKGPHKVTPEKYRRIEIICDEIFGEEADQKESRLQLARR